MMRNFFVVVVLAILALQSCKYANPSIMLRTPKDFVYDDFPVVRDSQVVIAKNDMLYIRVLADDGFKLVDVIGAENEKFSNLSGSSLRADMGQEYLVEYDGTVKLPIMGRIKLEGLKIREAEDYIEKLFSKEYDKPFVNIRINNQRVTVFTGLKGQARIVPLIYPNTTLFEVLAQAGGIQDNGKASMVKLIRGDAKKPKVYKIDLSSIEGMQQADLIVQSGDVIYVESAERAISFVTREIIPWFSLLFGFVSLASSIYIFSRLK
jgi:polysaccharide export outer membrane protein